MIMSKTNNEYEVITVKEVSELSTSNVFDVLSNIDVTNYLETKPAKQGGLSYLSWAAAWGLVKQNYPTASYTIHNSDDNNPFFTSPYGTFVKVSVSIEDQTLTEVLPVLDFKNKSIQNDKLNTFDINSAYKRCLVKCLAMHGLGLQVFVNGQGHGLDLNNKLVTSAPAKTSTSLF